MQRYETLLTAGICSPPTLHRDLQASRPIDLISIKVCNPNCNSHSIPLPHSSRHAIFYLFLLASALAVCVLPRGGPLLTVSWPRASVLGRQETPHIIGFHNAPPHAHTQLHARNATTYLALPMPFVPEVWVETPLSPKRPNRDLFGHHTIARVGQRCDVDTSMPLCFLCCEPFVVSCDLQNQYLNRKSIKHTANVTAISLTVLASHFE
jgi:hypothetical protein